jgi:hypothetical protein
MHPTNKTNTRKPTPNNHQQTTTKKILNNQNQHQRTNSQHSITDAQQPTTNNYHRQVHTIAKATPDDPNSQHSTTDAQKKPTMNSTTETSDNQQSKRDKKLNAATNPSLKPQISFGKQA